MSLPGANHLPNRAGQKRLRFTGEAAAELAALAMTVVAAAFIALAWAFNRAA